MKHVIGIININYECAETVHEVLSVWKEVRDGALSDLIEDVVISSSHQVFPETFKFGYPVKGRDNTIRILDQLGQEGVIDYLEIYEKPVHEADAWTDRIKVLNKEPDSELPDLQLGHKTPTILIMVNSDELWTLEEIRKAIEYVNRNPLVDWFKVNFKNFFGPNKWVSDFQVPRIWRNDRNGGVKASYCDDLMSFGNGKKDIELSHAVIPANLVRPAHFSWQLPPNSSLAKNREFCQRKLQFQSERYKICSYRWNNELYELELNPDYYRMIGKPMPEIYYEEILNT